MVPCVYPSCTGTRSLRQEIDAIYDSIGNVRRDIVFNKNDIDTLAVDVDGKIATLEEELEQLAPSLERGSWNFTLNHPPGPGEYTMLSAFLDEDDQEALCVQTLADCQIAANGDPLLVKLVLEIIKPVLMPSTVAVLSLLMTGLNVKSLSLTM